MWLYSGGCLIYTSFIQDVWPVQVVSEQNHGAECLNWAHGVCANCREMSLLVAGALNDIHFMNCGR